MKTQLQILTEPWPRMMTQAEAARYSGVSTKTFLRLKPAPPAPTSMADNVSRYDKVALDEWLSRLRSAAIAQPKPEAVDYLAKTREALTRGKTKACQS